MSSFEMSFEDLLIGLNKLTPSQQPVWGEMSSQRMVEHLSEMLRMAQGTTLFTLSIPEDKVAKMQDAKLEELNSKNEVVIQFLRKTKLYTLKSFSFLTPKFGDQKDCSAHLFSSMICCSSSGEKSFSMLKNFRISWIDLFLISDATFAQESSSNGLISR